MHKGNDFYVYIIFRLNGTPCYVGKGRGQRWQRHRYGSSNAILARIYSKHGELPLAMIRENLSNPQALEIERMLIAAIGRIVDGGPLVNFTTGGEGQDGHKQSPESVAKSAASRTGAKRSLEAREKMRLAHLGKVQSAEERAKKALAPRGKTHTKATIEKMRAIALANASVAGPKISATKMGHSVSAETRSKISSSLFRRGKNTVTPETRAKMRASRLGIRLSPETRAKIGLAQKGKIVSAETRLKISAAQKRATK